MRIATLEQIEGLRSLLGDEIVCELKEEYGGFDIFLFQSIDEIDREAEMLGDQYEITRCRRELEGGKPWALARLFNDKYFEH